MTGRDDSSSRDAGEDLDELLEPASELRSAVEQESESDSVLDVDESDRELPESELNEVLEPVSEMRTAVERQAAGQTGEEQDDEDCSGGCGDE